MAGDRLGDLEDLVRALREVARGGSVIDPAVVEAWWADEPVHRRVAAVPAFLRLGTDHQHRRLR
ncbi:MAG: hypothetical protein HOY78_28400 [Saccharothrix sp.]|nr:hypothetical protein [Saccharothrix sp.]